MDALSHILDDIHLSGAEYLYISGHGRWRFSVAQQTIFYVVLSGELNLHISEKETQHLEAGDIVFVPYGLTHHVQHTDTSLILEDFWLMSEFAGHRNTPLNLGTGTHNALVLAVRCLLDTDMGRPLLSSLPPYLLIRHGLNGSGPDWLRLGLEFLALEVERHRPGRDTLINRLIGMFLIECVRDYVEQLPKGTDNWLGALRDPYLTPVLSAIHAHPERAWTVVELAGLACLSRSAFAERFTTMLGQPPLAYLTQHRLRQAARHLALQDLSIGRISEKVGYASETAFSQAFKRQYGISPSQYRKERAIN
ncbi:AraC family transcriptional regulator [Agitococcus lubricus]|uniref:AraC family transcriptional regulator n=2 Tax=Agitococcus lubricus TaxID=1077255 RepID=A0A2T5IYR1_9GAMM|nr:AraC family transcriptional regulator [Agitococcus lubricus]